MNQNLNFKKSETYAYIEKLSKSSNISEENIVKNLKFSKNNIEDLKYCMVNDAANTIYKMIFSIISGITDMEMKNYSWATVKLYYSIFYFMKSKLLFDGKHIIYINGKSYVFDIKSRKFVKANGNTHKIVFDRYRELFLQRDILLNLIIPDSFTGDEEKPYDWYEDKRNIVNYRAITFEEPNIYSFWQEIVDYGDLDNLFQLFLNDKNNIYVTDENYAILSIPIYCLKNILLINDIAKKIDKKKLNYLSGVVIGKKIFRNLFKEIRLANGASYGFNSI